MKEVWCLFVNWTAHDKRDPDFHVFKGVFDTRMKAERAQDKMLDLVRDIPGFAGLEIEEWKLE